MKKAVVVLYPVKQFVDRDLKNPGINCIGLDVFERGYTQALGLRSGEFRQRFRRGYDCLLSEYRKGCYGIYWTLFSRQESKKLPATRSFSNVFTKKEEDILLPAGISYEDHTNRYRYPNEDKLVEKLKKRDVGEAVFGGFHSIDCVPRLCSVAQRLGLNARVDKLLTELFFHQMIRTFEQDVFAKAIAAGNLKAEMHEDDPNEEKVRLFEDRIPLEVLS